jgi:hypothetical protein
MHHAFRMGSSEIKADLLRNKIGFVDKRNFRTLLPKEMRHESTFGEKDNEPDYCFVVKAEKAPLIIDNLKKISIKIKVKQFEGKTNLYKLIFLLASGND